jgi:hypothetical protein
MDNSVRTVNDTANMNSEAMQNPDALMKICRFVHKLKRKFRGRWKRIALLVYLSINCRANRQF